MYAAMTADLAEVGVEAGAGAEDGVLGPLLLRGSAAAPWLEHPAAVAAVSTAIPITRTTDARTWIGVTSVIHEPGWNPRCRLTVNV